MGSLMGWWLVLYLLPLLVPPAQGSLMAHDEGYYALQGRWIVETGDWLTPQWWGEPLFDRTIGLQVLMALSFALWGRSEWSARLPGLLAAGVSSGLLVWIGRQLGLGRAAWLGGMILPLMGLWIHYAHLATQDGVLVAVELAGVAALLQAERSQHWLWPLLAGSMVGVGFWVKGVMIGVPVLALLPVLIQGGHGRRPALYLGLFLGGLPVLGWLGAAVGRYGWDPLVQLFGKVLLLSQAEWHPGNGWFYYFWNIPLNSFPWVFVALGGIPLLRGVRPRLYLLVYPGLMLLILTLFRTRTPYYALQLYPWIALLAGVSLDHLVGLYGQGRRPLWGLALDLLGVLGIPLLVLPGWVAVLAPYRLLLGIVAVGWLGLSVFWHWRRLPPRVWLGLWLVPLWLAIALGVRQGLLSDFSPQIKAGIPSLPDPMHFVVADEPQGEAHKTWILLGFYAPTLGQRVRDWQQLPSGSLAWLSPGALLPAPAIAEVEGWHLVRIP
ncbi:MAG: glycosyltransferase family 39 protein [Thermostichales cyanobacterium SZTDM-1c_bins_54]